MNATTTWLALGLLTALACAAAPVAAADPPSLPLSPTLLASPNCLPVWADDHGAHVDLSCMPSTPDLDNRP